VNCWQHCQLLILRSGSGVRVSATFSKNVHASGVGYGQDPPSCVRSGQEEPSWNRVIQIDPWPDPTRVNRKWYPLCNNNIWNPLLICAIIEASDLVHNLGLLRQLLGPKLTGTGLPEHPENFGSAYLFLQPLNLTTSTLVRNFGLGIVACQKTLGSKLAGSRLQQHLKICGTPHAFYRAMLCTARTMLSQDARPHTKLSK